MFPAKKCAKICAHNIRVMSTDESFNDIRSRLKTIPDSFDGVYQISLGPDDGIMMINNFVLTGKQISIAKTDYQNLHMQAYAGDPKAEKKLKLEMGKLEYLLWVCNSPVC